MLFLVVIANVAQGQRPPYRPVVEGPFCPDELMKIMRTCWAEDPEDRMTLNQVRNNLRVLGK